MNLKTFFLFLLLGVSSFLQAQVEEKEAHAGHLNNTKTTGKSLSPHTMAMAMVDGAHVHIDYSAPSVRDRVIFGGLVGFDRVWQAGAHNASWISTDKDLLIAGKKLPAGKYGFFLIPGKSDWTVIFNSRWDQHGKDEYNEAEDVLRLTVKPEDLKEVQEVLTYEVNKTGERSGEIVFSWEKKKLRLPFEVK
ncbi:MAG: DUF2911 domain-containing protein [Salinimicrobium sediminis]|nr:DUF2911 domain-containing protein [Salinimicrobium sediminis]